MQELNQLDRNNELEMNKTKTGPIYLDYHATTPVDPRVLDAMLPFFAHQFGNPASSSHSLGRSVFSEVEKVRGRVAKAIGAKSSSEIVFTSGGTESNNLALQGLAQALKSSGRTQILSSPVEHACVTNTLLELEKDGFEVRWIPVLESGQVCLKELQKMLNPKVGLVSIIFANNEIGTINSVSEIGQMCRHSDVLFHTDAVQAVGKLPIDVENQKIDLMTISGHKIYGPKGVGALYFSKQRVHPHLKPIIYGGGQEQGYRSGTLNAPGIVGLGTALELAIESMSEEMKEQGELRDQILNALQDAFGSRLHINGGMAERLPNNLNFRIEGVTGERFMSVYSEFAVSAGSACSSQKQQGSHVLRALGLDDCQIQSSIRLSVGRFTTRNEVRQLVTCLREKCNTLLGT